MANVRVMVIGKAYEVDFLQMRQTNVKTKKTRKIRLKEIQDAGMTPDADFAAKQAADEAGAAGGAAPGGGSKKAPDPFQNDRDFLGAGATGGGKGGKDDGMYIFQFYQEDGFAPGMAKWMSYPKAEQKLLADAWLLREPEASLGPGMRIDFRSTA